MNKLYRSRTDSKLTGLCGGIAEWLGMDASILRIVLIVAAFFTCGSLLFVYLLASLVIPKAPGGRMTPPAPGSFYHNPY